MVEDNQHSTKYTTCDRTDIVVFWGV